MSDISAWKAQGVVRFMAQLRERLLMQTDDNDTLRDTIEGEVNVEGCLEALMRARNEANARAAALRELGQRYIDGASAQLASAERLEAVIFEALTAACVDKFKGIAGTASIRQGGKSVAYANEMDIPPTYWLPQPPKLDKASIRQALMGGHEVAGCHLAVGPPSLHIALPRSKKKDEADVHQEA